MLQQDEGPWPGRRHRSCSLSKESASSQTQNTPSSHLRVSKGPPEVQSPGSSPAGQEQLGSISSRDEAVGPRQEAKRHLRWAPRGGAQEPACSLLTQRRRPSARPAPPRLLHPVPCARPAEPCAPGVLVWAERTGLGGCTVPLAPPSSVRTARAPPLAPDYAERLVCRVAHGIQPPGLTFPCFPPGAPISDLHGLLTGIQPL